jgi:1-acyl-sn-glycerol-3-phosphate acyltransferase
MLEKFFRGLIKLIISLTCKVTIIGQEKIPREGGCIVAANHIGRLDALFVYTVLPRNDVILTVAEKYQSIGFFRWAGRTMDVLWIDRFNTDFGTLRKVLQRLKKGEIYGVAPEGTRSKTEALQPGKMGTVYLAAKTQVPILPAAFTGTEDRLIRMNLKRLKRTPVTVTIGDPINLPSLPRADRDEFLQQTTDELMCQIAAMLPEKYHGVYAQHPRLQEILAH